MALYRSNKLATGACAPSLSPLPSLSALSSSDSASASRAEAAETFRAPAELAAAAAAAGAFRAMVVPRNTAAAAAAAASRRLSCAAGTADAIGFRAPKSPPPKLVAASTSLSDSEDSEEDSVDAVLSEKSSFTNGQSRWWLGTRRTSFRKASAAASAAPASPLTSAFGTGSKSGLPEAGDASAASLAPPPMAPGGTGGRGLGAGGGGAGAEALRAKPLGGPPPGFWTGDEDPAPCTPEPGSCSEGSSGLRLPCRPLPLLSSTAPSCCPRWWRRLSRSLWGPSSRGSGVSPYFSQTRLYISYSAPTYFASRWSTSASLAGFCRLYTPSMRPFTRACC
mmetsp:Transcript_62540/g.204075  ORF Transcript_62540/g.204075 Transcript_62540/m.204075 type:complete len:336 (-) Transcript_62540:1086-2093(-)